jgi:hypothetical protein
MKHLQPETNHEASKLTAGTRALEEHCLGVNQGEPLLYAMDGLLRYAKAYQRAYGLSQRLNTWAGLPAGDPDARALADDYALGPQWLAAAKGLRGLLNGQGAVAMELGLSSDSKDNGVIEGIFWAALGAAGFKESDL